jgi:hypothetical protein
MSSSMEPWSKILESAASIKTPISVAAVALVALVIVLKTAGRSPNRQLSKLLNLGLVLIVVVGLVPFVASWSLDYQSGQRKGIYRISVTVLDSDGVPSQNAHVRSSLDAVPKALADGGWELDIPAGARTVQAKVVIYARDEDTGATGEQSILLGSDENLSMTIQLTRPDALVRGAVTDSKGASLPDVKIMVVGYSSEAALSDANGGFVLPSHAAAGKRVKLHFEKEGFSALEDYFTAGGPPSSTTLKPK